jgi:hypothetical protein
MIMIKSLQLSYYMAMIKSVIIWHVIKFCDVQ